LYQTFPSYWAITWEIDHKNPKDKGGSDQLRNLQPLYWEENREKGAKTQHKGK